MANHSSHKTFISIIAALTTVIMAYLLWLHYFTDKTKSQEEKALSTPAQATTEVLSPTDKPGKKEAHIPEEALSDPSPEEEADGLGMTMEFTDTQNLVDTLAKQLQEIKTEDDLKKIALMLGNGQINSNHLLQLQQLFNERRLKLDDQEATQLIGDLIAGKKSRWALKLKDGSTLQLDLAKHADGTWTIKDMKLPSSNTGKDGKPMSPEAIAKRNRDTINRDSMNYTNLFMNTLTSLDFEKARSMVNLDKISDAKIAGLCILFEDGKYELSKTKPLQSIRMKDDIAAFYANVVSQNDPNQKTAKFSISVVREDQDKPWIIDEINLDRLLEDYANRVANGDIYYSPLIKNPNGGDTLVIYFEFDSEGLTERTEKQLAIVARLLKLDRRKKVTLSGHTDAKGSSEYNQGLSKERANAVKAYLNNAGIENSQIVTETHGFSKPRRPDTKNDGTDDPNARRANRRTEIYLDF